MIVHVNVNVHRLIRFYEKYNKPSASASAGSGSAGGGGLMGMFRAHQATQAAQKQAKKEDLARRQMLESVLLQLRTIQLADSTGTSNMLSAASITTTDTATL